MTTQKDVDQINAAAVVLRQQRHDEPPTIELLDALVTGHIALHNGTTPTIVSNLHIEGVDDDSLLAKDGRLHFALYIAGTEIVHGHVELATGAREVLVAA